MFQKICLGVCAVSTSITAIFCVWFFVGMVRTDQAIEKSMSDAENVSGAATVEQMAKEGEEIIRQLNQRAKIRH